MKSILSITLKLPAIFVLAGVAMGILRLAVGLFSWGHYQAAKTAKQVRKNAAILVLPVVGDTPSHRHTTWGFYYLETRCKGAKT